MCASHLCASHKCFSQNVYLSHVASHMCVLTQRLAVDQLVSGVVLHLPLAGGVVFVVAQQVGSEASYVCLCAL